MIKNYIVVYDVETTGLNSDICEITQIAAVVIDPRRLCLVEGAEFNARMRPLEPDMIEEGALRVTRQTRESLALNPHPDEVWPMFVRFVEQWANNGKLGMKNSPIPAGHNIDNYDSHIIKRYCKKYGTTRTDNGVEVQKLFHFRSSLDTIKLLDYWTFDIEEPSALSLDKLRKYMGMSQSSLDNAHDALQDVKDTANILIRLLNLSRRYAPKIIFKDCFDEKKMAIELEKRQIAKQREIERQNKTKSWGRGVIA